VTSHHRWSGSASCTHRLPFQTFLVWDMKFKPLTNSKVQDLVDTLIWSRRFMLIWRFHNSQHKSFPFWNARFYMWVFWPSLSDFHIVMCMCVLQTGFWIGYWIYWPLTRLGTRSTYNAIADCHILQITRAHAKSSQSDFTSRFLVTDLNSGDSSASVLTSFSAG
jgi:hypothetical protein